MTKMTKKFYYQTAGHELVDTVAFGDAWKVIVEYAKEHHTAITRKVVKDEEIREEYFAKGGVFLSMDHYKPGDEYILQAESGG